MSKSYDAITDQARFDFNQNGAVCIRGLFTDWIDLLKQGVQRNHDEPGPYFAENVTGNDTGRFWDDYCNWQRIPEFKHFITESTAAELSAQIMGSKTAQFFHDHVLVKEANTSKPTPWHQDAPYYFVKGEQTVSFWLPLDPVSKSETLRLVSGSNRWPKLVRPVTWLDDADFYNGKQDDYMNLPSIEDDAEDNKLDILEWEMEPGDAVLFNYRTVHGAKGNMQQNRRRAFSMRWLGDDARYIARPGKTSPPYPGHNMINGEHLRKDWFPVLWPAKKAD
jgi:ectoine hydroxylase-related dioxygenase (phytanoyl-CoA dioxygenase family)